MEFTTQFTIPFTVGDPGFKYHRTLTQLWGLVTLQFADLNILPFKYSDCSEYLYEALAGLSDRANALNISLDLSELKHSIDQLSQSSLALESYIQQSPGTSSAALNAQLYRAEREFLDSQGLPGRPWFKHVVQSPGLDQGYGADTFASILDALHDPLSAEHQVSLVSKRILSVSQHLSLAIQ
jgi:N-acetylated-alpha-linked acidic dipeptidase